MKTEYIHLVQIGTTICLAEGENNTLGVSVSFTRKPDQFARHIGRRITSGRIAAKFNNPNKMYPNTWLYKFDTINVRSTAKKLRDLIRDNALAIKMQVLRDQQVSLLFELITKAAAEGCSK